MRVLAYWCLAQHRATAFLYRCTANNHANLHMLGVLVQTLRHWKNRSLGCYIIHDTSVNGIAFVLHLIFDGIEARVRT